MIGANNDDTIQESDLTVAVLDGPDVDSGTAAEIGHASSVGKTIVGYRSDSRLCGDNEGSLVNLQVDYYIRKNGGFIVTDLASLTKGLLLLHPQVTKGTQQ